MTTPLESLLFSELCHRARSETKALSSCTESCDSMQDIADVRVAAKAADNISDILLEVAHRLE